MKYTDSNAQSQTKLEVRRTLEYFHRPGDVFEICLIKPTIQKSKMWEGFAGGKKPIISGWFDNIDAAVNVVAQADETANPVAIYATINPVKRSLLARANNRLIAGVSRTRDKEIAEVRRIFIDADPKRPAGISSTDEEKRLAEAKLNEIFKYLQKQGWPAPAVCDSGNGGHLVYLLADAGEPGTVPDVLKYLSGKFSDDHVDIDTTVGNPGRLIKIYGSMTRKGDSTESRPHRRAAIKRLPEKQEVVTREQLQALADKHHTGQSVPVARQPINPARFDGQRLDVPAYLSRYGVAMAGEKKHEGSTLYLLERCVFDKSHTGKESAIGQTDEGKLFYQCFHNSCNGRTWKEARQIISGDDPLVEGYGGKLQKSSPADFKNKKEWPEPKPIKAELPPVEKITERMIPDPFRAWVMDAADRMQVPPDFIIAPLLVVCGSIVGTAYHIRPKQKDDWSITPNLWGGIVGPPSTLKTPALNESVNKTLGRLEVAARGEHEQATSEHDMASMVNAAKVKAMKAEIEKTAKKELQGKKTKKSTDELAKELRDLQLCASPTERRYKTNDSSIEKLVELLEQNPRGLLYFRDELIGLFKRTERTGNEQDRAFLLEAWNGDGSHVDDRIGRGTVRTDNLCVSLLGGIQPDKLAGYLHQAISEGDNDGFVQRLQLLVYPDPVAQWQYTDRWPDTEAKNRAYKVIENIAAMECGEDEQYLRFSPEGQAIFIKWLTWLQTQKLSNQDEHPVILEHLAKYRSLMPTLALLFHLVKAADTGEQPGPVSEQAAKMAAAWCQYLESHARRIYSLALNTQQAGAAKLAKKIKKKVLKDGFKLRHIQMKKWSLLTSKELIKEALDYMIEKHWIRESIPPKIGNQGGRPVAPAYHVNPKIFSECTK